MGAGHTHHESASGRRRPSRMTLAVLVPAALVTLAAVLLLWPGDRPAPNQPEDAERVNGTVTAIDEQPCPPTPDGGEPGPDGGAPEAPGRCGTADVTLTDGPEVSTTVTVGLPTGPGAPTVAVDDDVVLMYLPDSPDGQTYQILDHQRGSQLWILAAAFALAVVAFGRIRGITALAGLAVTFGVLLFFVVPAILDGKPPLLVAIVGSAAIMLTVLYLTHGFATSTSVAVVGTLAALTLTGLLSAGAVAATHLSGIADEQTSYLGMIHHVDMQGLLLAGILIGSLGVLDDVTVTQVSAVWELRNGDPQATARSLYAAGIRIGRDHIASAVNTLVLAYSAAALPLLLLFTQSGLAMGDVLATETVAVEVVQTLVGSIGLVASVPITTALAAWVATRTTRATPTDPPTRPQRGPEEPDGPDDFDTLFGGPPTRFR